MARGAGPGQTSRRCRLLVRGCRLPPCNNSSAIQGNPEARGATLTSNAFELSASFRPRTFERIEHPIGAVNPLLVVVDFHAQRTTSEWVIRSAPHPNSPSNFDRYQRRAGVGTIVRQAARMTFGRSDVLAIWLSSYSTTAERLPFEEGGSAGAGKP